MVFNYKNRTNLYILLQIIAWGLVVFQQVLIAITFNAFEIKKLNVIICIAILGLITTHCYRYIVKKRSLFNKPLYYQFIFAVVSAIIISCILEAVSIYGSLYFIMKKNHEIPLMRHVVIAMNIFIMIATWLILYHMYKYFEQLEKVEEKKWMFKKEVLIAENELLQLQINPHFLFNALNSVRSLILLSEDKAIKGVQVLDYLLNNGYSKNGFNKIEVHKEIEIIKKYIYIEQLRFNEKLVFTFNIEQASLNFLIPAGLILTLVENAVKHGFNDSEDKNEIDITVHLEQGSLCIKVTNHGQFKEKAIPSLYSGIGLKNIKTRLERFYGKDFLLKTENLIDDKVKVTLLIMNIFENTKLTDNTIALA